MFHTKYRMSHLTIDKEAQWPNVEFTLEQEKFEIEAHRSITIKCLNSLQMKFTFLFKLQLMEDGPFGVSGVHAVFPVEEELVKEAESVRTQNRQMVGRTVPVAALSLGAAMNIHVLVSLLANEVLWCITYHLQCPYYLWKASTLDSVAGKNVTLGKSWASLAEILPGENS